MFLVERAYCIRAFAAGMVFVISCQNLPSQHKKRSTTGRNWHGKAKRICNTAIVPLQICDGTAAVLQIQKLLFYSTYNFCTVSYPLSTVSFFFSLSSKYIILLYRYIILLCRYIILMCSMIK